MAVRCQSTVSALVPAVPEPPSIMKVSVILLLFTFTLSATLAEPPIAGYSTTQQDSFAPPPASGPSSSYGPPSSSYGPPSSGRFGGSNRQTTAVLRPSSSYGAPSGGGFRGTSSFGGRRGGSRTPSSSYGVPSSGYGTPSGGGSYNDGSSEPASYQFSYHVQDAASGNDFGHMENREGQVAKGMYMVLLPDGRRQIVEYVADESGYHPTVRYEGTATNTGTGGGYPGRTGGGGGGGYRY